MKTLSKSKTSSPLQIYDKRDVVKRNHNHKELYDLLNDYNGTNEEYLLSIIMPVYNEENTVSKVIQKLPVHDLIEIIVVDDHSTDASLDLIRKADYRGDIHIIQHKENRGYGAALLTGIHHSNGKIFMTLDSDGQHDPYDIVTLVKPILEGRADITIGSRYKGTYNYKLPLVTRFGEALLEVIIRFFFWQKVKNNQSGFRAFHHNTYKIFEDIRFHGYAFTTELLLSAALKDKRIREYPIHLKNRAHGASYIVLYKLLISLGLCVWLYILKNTKRLFQKGKRKRR